MTTFNPARILLPMLALFIGCDSGNGHTDETSPAPTASGSTGGAEATSDTGDLDDGSSSDGDPRDSSSSTSRTDQDDESSSSGDAVAVTPWTWELPQGFPMPEVPSANPMTVEGVELGRHLFFDTRLSVDGTYACSTCHDPALAFTDGRDRSEGVTGELHPRSSMSLANVGYAATLAWGNPELLDLETHALGPIFGTDPVEMGLADEADLVAKLEDEPRYAELFAAAYPDDPAPINLDNTTKAIASFQRSIVSGNAPFDRWFYGGDEDAVSDAVKRGWDLFNFPGECTYCHFSFNFSDSTYFDGVGDRPLEFHNTGLYNEDGEGAYPPGNEGLFNFTNEPADMGRFKSPTLRNIAVTAPYMHDGSIETLEEVVEHYAVGGRVDTPHADFQMKTFTLRPDETADLVAFMEALTDEEFLNNPRLQDPWAL